ncbi:MAG: DUF2066 domain-containing protein [Pseudomonadota bacterium]
MSAIGQRCGRGAALAAAFMAIAVSALFSASAEAASAARDVFTVARVPVKASASDSTIAKAEALSSGRREAMRMLLRRLTQRSDWSYLPGAETPAAAGGGAALTADQAQRLAEGGAIAPQRQRIALSDAQIERMEKGFQVFNEKARGGVYRAEVTYIFRSDAVRGVLKAAHLPYSEVQSQAALLIPVLQMDEGLMLWEPENPWAKAWRRESFAHELRPVATPLGDLNDIALLDARGALSLNQEALGAIAKRYGVERVVVAHGLVRRTGGQDQLSVRLIEAFQSAVVEGETTPPGGVVVQSRFNGPKGQFEALTERAVDSVFGDYAEQWKARTLIDHSSSKQLSATAYFTNLDEWLEIRRALSGAAIVEGVQVAALSPQGAYLTLVFLGSAEQLRVTLEQEQLTIWSDDGERWSIASRERAAELRAKEASPSWRFGG